MQLHEGTEFGSEGEHATFHDLARNLTFTSVGCSCTQGSVKGSDKDAATMICRNANQRRSAQSA